MGKGNDYFLYRLVDIIDYMGEIKGDLSQSGKKEKYGSFLRGEGTAASDIKDCLGISVPSDVRTFYYDEGQRFKKLRRIFAALKGGFDPESHFSSQPDLRGGFSSEHKALFVKPGDTFAELHEVGHSIVGKVDHNFRVGPSEGWEKRAEIKDKVTRQALDEGIPQWIAVATAFRKQTPESLASAKLENNKMVGKSADADEFDYDKDVVLGKVARVKEQVDAFVEEKWRVRHKDAMWQRDIVDGFIERNYRDFISLGYVYTSSVVAEEAKEPGFDLDTTLGGIIKSPPTYDEFMSRVSGYDGEQFFSTAS